MRKKRLLAMLLTISMLLGVLSVGAMAEGDNVAQVGETTYATLQEAIDAASAGDTVKLLDNVDVTKQVEIKRSLILDLGGHKVTSTKNGIKVSAGTGNVKIQNGEVEGKPNTILVMRDNDVTLSSVTVTATDPSKGAGVTAYQGDSGKTVKLTIEDSEIHGARIGLSVQKYADVTVKDTNISGTTYGVEVQGDTLSGSDMPPATSFTMTGGSIKAQGGSLASLGIGCSGGHGTVINLTDVEIESSGTGVYHPQLGSMTIKGGSITAATGVRIEAGHADRNAPSGSIVLDGVSITATGKDMRGDTWGEAFVNDGAAVSIVDRYYQSGVPSITISGGTFTSEKSEAVLAYTWNSSTDDTNNKIKEWPDAAKNISISEGTFSSDVSDFVENGDQMKQDDNGSWVVAPYVAAIDNKNYTSLQAAIEVAQSGDTVTLLKNVTLNTAMEGTSAILINKNNITFDGGDKTITVSGNFHGIQVWKATGVKIQNVTITGAGKDALLVNQDSEVTATNLNTSGNNWGAVNVDKNSQFELVSGNLSEASKIWTDDEASKVKVPEDWNSFVAEKTDDAGIVGTQTFYTTGLDMSLNETDYTLYSNSTPNTVTLTPTLTGVPEGKTPVVTWESSDETVATVDGGVVTAVSNGTATITATCGGLEATCAVTVRSYTYSGGGTITPTPTPPEEDIDDPDVPLARPWLFTDVKEGDWFYDAVKFVFDGYLMDGTGTTTFEPNAITNRAMIVTILYRMENEPEVEAETKFSDVADGRWYTEAVAWAAANGIAQGYEDGTFQPLKNVSRQELAAFLSRYATYKTLSKDAKGDLDQFTDKDSIQGWATEAMSWAVGAEVMQGKGEGILDPAGNAKRCEAAKMIMNLCEKFDIQLTTDETEG